MLYSNEPSSTAIPSVKSLHVYDFDNTLFRSPLPNSKLWDGRTASTLQSPEGFGTGGWWHNPVFLEATGEGIEKEEPRAWEGFWNEQIVRRNIAWLSSFGRALLNLKRWQEETC